MYKQRPQPDHQARNQIAYLFDGYGELQRQALELQKRKEQADFDAKQAKLNASKITIVPGQPCVIY